MARGSDIDESLREAHLFYCKVLLFATSNSHIHNLASLKAKEGDEAKIALIAALYIESIKILYARYFQVAGIYLCRRRWSRRFYILNIDRSDFATVASANYIRSEMRDVIQELRISIDPKSNISVVIQKIICPPHWTILKELSDLLMEEISFLAKRVDDITNMMIGLIAQLLTLGVIILTAGLFWYTIIADQHKETFEKELSSENIKQMSTVDADFDGKMQGVQKVDEKLDILKSSLDNISTNIVLFPQKIEALKEPLNDIKLELSKPSPPPITINNNMPAPAASNKQNGIINVETSR